MRSIKTRYTLVFCVVLAISLGLVAVGAVIQSQRGMVAIEHTALSMKLDGDIESAKQYLKSFDKQGAYEGKSHDFVDRIQNELDVACTIFVKDGDDFIRMTTSIVKSDGQRATGTYLGKDSAAYPSMVSGKRFRGEAFILGDNYLTVYEPIVDKGQTVAILFAGLKMTEVDNMIRDNLKSVRLTIGLGSLLMLIIGGIVTYILSKRNADPIIELVDATKKIAQYNLSQPIADKLCKKNDEIGQMAQAIDQLQEGLKKLVEEIAGSSKELGLSSEQLNASADQSATTSEEVAQTLNEIAQNATQQARETGQSVQELDMLGRVIEEDRQEIEAMNNATDNVRQLVGEGLGIVNELIDTTKANSDAAGVVFESIQKTNESSSNIGDASHLIASIADQTNLLALNAAIEAARAGEHGKGFAVVAEEIRKLAEQSTQSTKNIDNMVMTLKEDAQLAVQKMEEAAAIVENQEECVYSTEEKYKEIMEAMETSDQIVQRLTKSSNNMEERKSKVQEATHALSAIAQENAAATEEASAGMEEQTATVQEVASSSGVLNALAGQLEELIQQFQLR